MSDSQENKYDAGKARWDYIPQRVLQGVAEVLTFGAAKYAPYGWADVSNAVARYRAAAERHFFAAVFEHENCDPESDLPHAWHYACNHLFIAWLMVYRPDQVDQYRHDQDRLGPANPNVVCPDRDADIRASRSRNGGHVLLR